MVHRVRRNDYQLWKPIWEEIVSDPNNYSYIASTYRPGSGDVGENTDARDANGNVINVPASRWAKVITSGIPKEITNQNYNLGVAMTETIWQSFQSESPGMIVFDELTSKNVEFFAGLGDTVRNDPRFNGMRDRIGVYIVSADWDKYRSAIDALLSANITLLPEYYIQYVNYCTTSSTQSKRDDYLHTFIDSPKRTGFLTNLKVSLNSSSKIVPIIAVTDNFVNGDEPYKMIDRMFWAWANSPQYNSLITVKPDIGHGGMGSWKWDSEGGQFEDNVGRAEQFVKSWVHYCKNKKKTVRSGAGIPKCSPGMGGAIVEFGALTPPGGTNWRNTRSKARLDDNRNKIEKASGRARLARSKTAIVNGKLDLNRTTPQVDGASYFDLYITEVNYGYSVQGEWHTAKYYTRFYPKSFSYENIRVKGIAIDERDYDDLLNWIRQVQVDIARGATAYMYLQIPATNLQIWGFIPTMPGKVGVDSPIPVGIEYNFDFVVIRDISDKFSQLTVPSHQGQFFDRDPYWIAQYESFKKDFFVTEIMSQLKEVSKDSAKASKKIKASVLEEAFKTDPAFSSYFFRDGLF